MANMIPSVHNIYDLINLIRLRPGLYIGDARISTMRTFLDGYQFASLIHDIEDEAIFPPFWYFHEWAMRTYGWGESTAGWANIILKEHGLDQEKALQTFFDLVDEFKTLKPVSIQQVKLSSQHIAFHHSELCRIKFGDGKPLYEQADLVLLVEFSHDFGYSCFVIHEQKVEGLHWRERYKNEASAKEAIECLFGPQISWEHRQGDLKKAIERYL